MGSYWSREGSFIEYEVDPLDDNAAHETTATPLLSSSGMGQRGSQ